jgi:sigma-B regulation protein RsbU (phosphoserine phosphatase)
VLTVTAKGFESEWISASVKGILGYEVEEALAPDWWIGHLHPDDKEAAIEKTSILMTQGHLVQEYRFQSKDGHFLWVRDEASYLRDGDGRPKEIVGFWTNITERKLAEEYAQRLATIVEFSDDAIISKDLNAVITSWNRGAEHLFGYTAEEAIGKPITILIPPDRQDEEPEILERIRRGQQVDHYETVRRRKDGSLVDISLTASPVKNAQGKIIGASKIARDITVRRQAEEQAARAREREVEIGFKIQQTLLLDQPPRDVRGARVAALTIPSKRISGDFYAFFRHVDQCLDVIVGDVMGKGIPAALLGAASKSTFLQALSEIISLSDRGILPRPQEIVTLAHAKIVRQLLNLESFVTVSYARFDLDQRQVELVDCGHMPVIHYQQRTGSYTMLRGSNVPLGVSEGEIYEHITEPFEPEDVFVFYSDGITEAQNSSGEFFGISRLAECVRINSRLDALQLITKIRRSVVAFSNSETFADDLTCVVVKIEERKLPIARSEIEIPSDLSELAQARAFVHEFCQSIPGGALPQESTAELDLGVNEALSNIMKHAYRGRTDQRIQIGAEAWPDQVTVRLHHLGEPFDPAAVLPPVFNGSREEGFGVYMIAQLVDEVRYSRDERGRNCILLVKKRQAIVGFKPLDRS